MEGKVAINLEVSHAKKAKTSYSEAFGSALAVLYDEVGTGVSIESFWDSSVNAMMALLSADKGLLLLYSKQDQGYIAKSSRGFIGNQILSKKYLNWRSVSALVGKSYDPVILKGIGKAEILKHLYPQLIKKKSYLAIPLRFAADGDSKDSEDNGVFFVFDKRKKNCLFKEDITLFSENDVSSAKEFVGHIIRLKKNITHTANLKDGLILTSELLVTAIESKLPFFSNHTRRVIRYCRIMSSLMGLSQQGVEKLLLAAALHDIGMLGIDMNILSKPERLSKVEVREVQSHVVKGVSYIKHIPMPWNIGKIIYHHHERYDGRGYPDHLKEDEIPIESRIIGVADCYDALLSPRPYRRAFDFRRAVLYMRQLAGNQLDPNITQAFLKLLLKVPKLREERTKR